MTRRTRQEVRARYNRLTPCIILHLAPALYLYAAGTGISSRVDEALAPPWAHVPIAGLTSSVPAPQPPAPAQASLRALATPPPAPETLPSLPSAFRIASIPAHTPADTTNLTDKLETADVAHVLAQAEDALRSGRQAEARALVESALERVTQTRPRFILHHRLGALAFKLRDYDLAITHMKQALDLEPGQAALTCNLAAALMTRGEVAEALDLLSSLHVNLIRNARLRFSVHFNLACAHALSGNIDQAVSNLQHAAHYDAYATMASAGDTQLDAIRNDPRVQDLIRGLEQEHLGALREPSNLIQ